MRSVMEYVYTYTYIWIYIYTSVYVCFVCGALVVSFRKKTLKKPGAFVGVGKEDQKLSPNLPK